jgi:N-acetylmuramoyl-L-alanine amidase
MLKDLLEALTLIFGIAVASDEQSVCPPRDDCVALAVWYESVGEPVEGQMAVAEAVLARGRDACAVISAPDQFPWYVPGKAHNPGKRDPRGWGFARGVAFAVLRGARTKCQGANSFYAHDLVTPKWSVGQSKCVIAGHSFLWLPDRCINQLECGDSW